MAQKQAFNPCVPRMVQCGKNLILVFDTPYFELKNCRYKIIQTELTKDDAIHTVMNIDTREFKDIPLSKLKLWFK